MFQNFVLPLFKWISRRFFLLKYNLSPEKRELDDLIKKIRRIEPLSDEKWKRLQELARNERNIIIEPGTSGFQRIMYHKTDVVSGEKIRL